MRIVITREPSRSSRLEEQLREAGHQVSFMPLTCQVLPEDTQPLEGIIEVLQSGEAATRYAWLLLTSGNTVRALVACGWDGSLGENFQAGGSIQPGQLGELGKLGRATEGNQVYQGDHAEQSDDAEQNAKAEHGLQIGVVGSGTASVLAEYTGHTSPWMPQRPHATGILEELPAPGHIPSSALYAGPAPHPADTSGPQPDAAPQPARVLLPQSAQARPTLSNGLMARGWQVDRMTAYETLPLPEARGRQRLSPAPAPEQVISPAQVVPGDVVLITSSTAAAALEADQSTRAESIRGESTKTEMTGAALIAIGEPTAQTMRELKLPVSAVLEYPTAEALLAAAMQKDLD